MKFATFICCMLSFIWLTGCGDSDNGGGQNNEPTYPITADFTTYQLPSGRYTPCITNLR